MLNQEQFKELLTFQTDQEPVLSLYLGTDATKESIEITKRQVRGMLKESGLDQTAGAATIEKYLAHSYNWTKPGIAMFATADGRFFRDYPTAVSFRNRLRVGQRPYLKPLTHLLDHYAHYGVVLVDRVGAKFYEFHLGELQAVKGYMGENSRKIKKGSGSSAVGMRGGVGGGRREDEVMQRNLREAAAAAQQFFAGKPIRRLFLGGTAETTAQFREILPKQMQSTIAGAFAIDMTANENEVRQRSLSLLESVNAERENQLVKNMLAAAAAGKNAAIGLDDTLQAVSEKRVKTLVVSDGFRAPGYTHRGSGFVVSNLAKSPMGHQELTEITDVIEEAVANTMAGGGHVEIISGNDKLENAGRIGAILRY
ncbi:MAG: hypothetical protein ACE5FD_12845 [Anaerolineae bacterium]